MEVLTNKDELIQKMPNKEPTYELPGLTTDEVIESLKIWATLLNEKEECK